MIGFVSVALAFFPRALLRVLLLVIMAIVPWLFLTAATGTTQQVANVLVVLFIWVIEPVVLKYVKLDGAAIQSLNYLLALVVAGIAGVVSGELRFDFSSTALALTFVTSLLGIQQFVVQLIKDHQGGPGPIPALSALVK